MTELTPTDTRHLAGDAVAAERDRPHRGERPRRQPPKALFTHVVNPVMRTILRSPLHRPLSGKLALLTFTGRRSGRRYTIPVSYVREGQTVLFGTESGWKANFRGAGGTPVRLRLAGRERSATAEVIDDEAGMTEAYATILRLDPGYARFIDVRLDPGGRPLPEDVRAARARGLVVIRATVAED